LKEIISFAFFAVHLAMLWIKSFGIDINDIIALRCIHFDRYFSDILVKAFERAYLMEN